MQLSNPGACTYFQVLLHSKFSYNFFSQMSFDSTPFCTLSILTGSLTQRTEASPHSLPPPDLFSSVNIVEQVKKTAYRHDLEAVTSLSSIGDKLDILVLKTDYTVTISENKYNSYVHFLME